MSESSAQMTLIEKTSILLGIVSALTAFAVLILGDNILRLTYRPDIYLNTNTVALENLGGSSEHVRVFDFYNAGTAASSNLKIVIRFNNPHLRFTVESDEEVKESIPRSSLIEISLGRLSPRSHLKISVLSKKENPFVEAYYIDDSGKTKIDPDRRNSNQDQWIRISAVMTVIFAFMGVSVILIRKAENRIASGWSSSLKELIDKMDQLKSEVLELRGNIDEFSKNSAPHSGSDGNGDVQRRLRTLLDP